MRWSANHDDRTVLVVGLGRFGSALALSLKRQGREVLAVDANPAVVQAFADDFTHIVAADMTQPDVVKQLGVGDFERAVVAIGSDVEASVLTAMALVEAGVQELWAKAVTRQHGAILERIGVTHVVYPEHAMGEQVAHMIAGRMRNYIEFDDDFAIARTGAPQQILHKTLTESGVRTRWGITVVGLKRQGQDFIHATETTEVLPGDELVISGPTAKVERFSALPR